MCLKHCKRIVRHIRQRSMCLLFSTHTSSTCSRYVTRDNLAVKHGSVSIHNSGTAVGHVLASYNVLHELELGVFLTHNRYTTVHGVQICCSEAEGPQGYACNLYLCVDRCTVDIGTGSPLYVVTGNNTGDLREVQYFDAGTGRIDGIVNNIRQHHCVGVRHTGPDNFGAGDLSIRLLICKFQTGLYNSRILAQDYAAVAGVLACNEVHRLRVVLHRVTCNRSKVHDRATSSRTRSIYALPKRVIVIQALENIVERLQHALSGGHGTKHVYMCGNTYAILSIHRTLSNDATVDRLTLGVHDTNFGGCRARQRLRSSRSSIDHNIFHAHNRSSCTCNCRRKRLGQHKHGISIVFALDVRDNIFDAGEDQNITSCDICSHSGIARKSVTGAQRYRDICTGL